MSAALDTTPMFDTPDDQLVAFCQQLVAGAKSRGEVTMSLPQCQALLAHAREALKRRRAMAKRMGELALMLTATESASADVRTEARFPELPESANGAPE